MSESTGSPVGPFSLVVRGDPAIDMTDEQYEEYVGSHLLEAKLAPFIRDGMKPTRFCCVPVPGSHVMLDLAPHTKEFSQLSWYACAAACHRIEKADGTVVEAKGRDLGPDLHGARRASDAWMTREIYESFGPSAIYEIGALVWIRAQLREADRNP